MKFLEKWKPLAMLGKQVKRAGEAKGEPWANLEHPEYRETQASLVTLVPPDLSQTWNHS